jgi:NAD(P)-dependent dehydrogenase (short-subunit alcohol dehydrogenase family)
VESFDGRTVVITGGGSGIGRGTALAFARAGANVVVADCDDTRVAAVADEVQAIGVGGLGVVTDVGSDDDMTALRDATVDTFGRVDVVMNNVGIITIGKPETIPLDEWRHAIEVNLLSVVRSLHLFVPLLLAQVKGTW